jgi:hypothetical protein
VVRSFEDFPQEGFRLDMDISYLGARVSRRFESAVRAPGAAVATIFALVAVLFSASALVGCSPSPAKPAACQPACEGKSGGDDGCGGICPASTAACAACAPTEACVDGRCVCQPSCNGKRAGADGCGGTCACPAGTEVAASGECVAPGSCSGTCKSAGAECGDVCGESCGTCEGAKACNQGKCLCVPRCDGTRCDDGCGGTCECAGGTVCAADGQCVAKAACTDSCSATGRTCGSICGKECGTCADGQGCRSGKCEERVTCADCGLQLRVLAAKAGTMTVAIDYAPDPGAPNPRLGDIRFRASSPVLVQKVTPGAALAAAGKELYVDPKTKQPFRLRDDGALQMVIQSVASAAELREGRIATVEVSYDAVDPVALWLVRRDEVFAPPPADHALQASPYDRALMVGAVGR